MQECNRYLFARIGSLYEKGILASLSIGGGYIKKIPKICVRDIIFLIFYFEAKIYYE